MAILQLRILPPLAIGRLGSSPTPLEAFELTSKVENPLGFRTITPRETLEIDPASGAVARCYVPENIRFKEKDGSIRPVSPFLEVFALTDCSEELQPLTLELLAAEGLSVENLSWSVEVGNIKVFRRTNDPGDKIIARVSSIKDHQSHPLQGECANFLPGKVLPLGDVRFIRPTEEFPQIRLRYTPAAGKVYGASLKRYTSYDEVEDDPIITSADQILYDVHKGGWRGYSENGGPALTNPAQIYAGYLNDEGIQTSWGYLDDECDGIVTVYLALSGGAVLSAQARIGAGPPAFAPDTLPVRVIADELEQILLGPEVEGEVSIEVAEELVYRALETVRLMNTAVMNGNAVDGRLNVASTMVRQDTNDFGRYYEPIMAQSLVDNLAVRALHARVFAALRSGAAPWFAQALRQPDDIGDLSNEGRRKMPALMRGADGRALTLTHRQINLIIQAASQALFRQAETSGHTQGKSDDTNR
jgi:hypothetical protein